MTGADLTFDALTHTYFLGDQRIPSVTRILAETGVSIDFEALAASSRGMASVLDRKRQVGVAVHGDCHALDDDDLELEKVHPDVLPYVQAWKSFRDAHTFLIPMTRERRVYHPGLRYCGTLDGLFKGLNATPILIDIKTGDPASSAARYQTALYQLAWDAEHPEHPIGGRWAVQLTPDLAVPYRVHVYTDYLDFATARAIVTTYHASARRAQEVAA